MNIKQLKRKYKKRAPKVWERAGKHWEYKMIFPIGDFIQSIVKNVNPRITKHAKKDDYIIDGIAIEKELDKVLKKLRRITLLEKK